MKLSICFLIRNAILTIATFLSTYAAVFAQDTKTEVVTSVSMPTFKPFKLVGDWKFVNNGGTNYGGEIEIAINSVDSKGIMHGQASYDGRQTNSICGTKLLFNDKPVDAEIIKITEGYQITFEYPCLQGTSPRTKILTLVCDANGVCSMPEILPHGKGMTVLTNKLPIQKKIEFKPYKLVGDWKFKNKNTGQSFNGDIEIAINSIDSKNIMHGFASYDGRQNNEKCGTKSLFTDKPVEVEIIKTTEGYRIAFENPCSIGISPRMRSFTLMCDISGICINPNVTDSGNGVTTLTEKR